MLKAISLLVKPASGLCNMRCDYCFYRDELSRRNEFEQGFMSDANMELLIRRACESAENNLQIAFQGGEPTLVGLDYFRKFADFLEHAGGKKLQVSYSIQTNGLLLDENWMDLFRRYHFLVGLSFDGTAGLHDRFRPDTEGKGTAARVRNAWELLRKNHIDTNISCVVTGKMARRPEKVYHYLKEMGAGYLQFIPCMESEVQAGRKPEWELKPKDYAYFLKGIFDLWYREWKNGCYISIRNFDDYIHLLCGYGAATCAANGECGGYLVVEHDGSVYPCDFYVEDEWCLGNLAEDSMEELRLSDKMRDFLSESRALQKHGRCTKCDYFMLCRGGCRHDRIPVGVSAPEERGGEQINIYCEAYQEFFEYALPRMLEIAQIEKNGGF